MLISRSYLTGLDRSTAYYVVCHSEWRRRRGKKEAAVTYGGIRNPGLARDLACSVMGKLIERDASADKGERLLQSGKNYWSSWGDELAQMIQFITEASSVTTHFRLKNIAG